MEPALLLKRAVDCLRTHNADLDTVDVHVRAFLGVPAAVSPDDVFVQQVFYGCVRQERALRVFLNALYHLHSASLNRRDHTLFLVLSYLILFRLPEVGMRRLAPLLDSQDAAKMHALLSFAMDAEVLREWVVEGWCKFLDRAFVEQLLAALDQLRPEATAWLDSRYVKAFGHSQALRGEGGGSPARRASLGGGSGTGSLAAPPRRGSLQGDKAGSVLADGRESGSSGSSSPPPPEGVTAMPRKPPTVPVAPRITQPKPRLPAEPLRIPQYVHAEPVPEWIERTTLEDVEARRAAKTRETRERTRAKYDFDKTVPRLHASRNTVNALRAEVEAQRERDRVPAFRARPPPPLPATGADVKLNTAAILREDAVLTAKHAKEAAVIRDFEGTLRDTTEYFAWQEAQRRKDEAMRLFAVDERKRESAESACAAKASSAVNAAQSRAMVQDMRAVGAVVAQHVALERSEEVEMRRRIAEQVKDAEFMQPALARAATVQRRRRQHDRVREASAAAETALEKQREQEQARRTELLRQIRALERVPTVQIRTFDPNALSGVGLLAEMSLVELHDRLALLQRSDIAREQERRREILREKREHAEVMLARVDNIQRMRAQRADTNVARRSDAKDAANDASARAAHARDEKLLALSATLVARRAAREAEARAIAEDHARREKEAQFLGGQSAETEAARLQSRLLGMELRSQREQELALAERAKELHVGAAEARAADVRAAEAAARAVEADKLRRLELMRASREEQAFRVGETARRKHMFIEAADRETALLGLRDSLNEYAATKRYNAQDRARAARGGLPRDEQRQQTLERRLERLPEGHPLALTLAMRVTQGVVSRAERTRVQHARAAEEEALGVSGLPE